MTDPWDASARRVRIVRLVSDLVLFAFATSHLVGHAMGLFSLDAMDRVGRLVLLAPWRAMPGQALLLVSLLAHAGSGLWGFVHRRGGLRPVEAVQIGFGLTIPLVLLPSVVDVQLGAALFGLDNSDHHILSPDGITGPFAGLGRQFVLLMVLWTYGCIGLHLRFRFRGWYRRWAGVMLAGAVALPVLAMLGIVNAGWNTQVRAMLDSGVAAAHRPAAGSPGAAQRGVLAQMGTRAQFAYLALLAAAAGVRFTMMWRRRRRGCVVTYAGRPVRISRGDTLLEASRLGRMPQAAVCGGHARCTTCRVKIVAGGDRLPPPTGAERAMLAGIGAPPDVRLACQTVPTADVAVRPLIATEARATRHGIAFAEGQERTVTAMAVDLRDSTGLAEANLPFDTLYLVNRYLSAVLETVHRHGGYVTSVAGDGVMCVFGLDAPASEGARSGLLAARDIWTALRDLDGALAEDGGAGIRFGIGLHSGVAILGAVARSGATSLQFLGDTGNVASRLEALTKEKTCVVIASRALLEAADLPGDGRLRVDYVRLRGREAALPIALFRTRGELSGLLGLVGPA